ncbi:MAG: apolipoprotein N-acyltransferase [Actinomycetota bacterium]|nr:apolipoprotein N-acyltransferase [Actinomycetota bacterium]
MSRARLVPLLLALVGGLCVAASMPPWGWWPLAPLGIALFDAALAAPGRPRRSGAATDDASSADAAVAGGADHEATASRPRARTRVWRTWLFGVAWLLPSTLWMADLTLPGWIVAGLVFPLYLAAGAALLPPGRWRWLAMPGLFVLYELARWSFPFGGVPLSTLAMSQAASPLGPSTRLAGTLGLVALTVTAGVGLAAMARRRFVAVAIAAGVLVAAMAASVIAPGATVTGTLDVAVVQGGGPQRTRAVDTDERVVFERHLEASEEVELPVDLVVWPENVVNVDGPLEDNPEFDELSALAQRLDATLVVGVVESFDDHFLNAAIAFDPNGDAVARYDKVRRVPFGEYVPLRSIVNPLSGGAADRFIPRDARPGDGESILDTPVGILGVAISWEIFFDERGIAGARPGGQVLLNPTNGSSYWLTIVQSQQVASSRLRALETDRWVLQAAPTGFSAIVTPDGEVVDRTGISEQRVLSASVELLDGETIAVRFGRWPMVIIAVATWAGAWFGALAERRRSADPDETVTTTPA